jgi:hypothetical protein
MKDYEDDKDVGKMRNNPKAVRPDDLDKVLVRYGFEWRQMGTSHRIYRRGRYMLTIAQHKPYVHSKAVKQALATLDEIFGVPE